VRFRYLFVFGVGLVACGSDTTTAPTIGEVGSLSFSYTGAGVAGTATFSATGALPADTRSTFGTTPWAVGSTATAGEIDIAASIPKTSTTWDFAILIINRTTVGTTTIGDACGTGNCPTAYLASGTTLSDASPTFSCGLTTGTITIATITSTHVTGSFSGTGTCLSPDQVSSPFAMTGGTFDLGLSNLNFGAAPKTP
jgi:hypothetical protein